jgi:hypothetical protein
MHAAISTVWVCSKRDFARCLAVNHQQQKNLDLYKSIRLTASVNEKPWEATNHEVHVEKNYSAIRSLITPIKQACYPSLKHTVARILVTRRIINGFWIS